MRNWIGICSLLICLVQASSTNATTIRVARDGSGDFAIVAEAVTAAASGDTVTIAPGIYPEVRPFITPGGPAEYVAWVEVAELRTCHEITD